MIKDITPTTGPLEVMVDDVEHGVDEKQRFAVRDTTPRRNLVGYMLLDDAIAYVRARNEGLGSADWRQALLDLCRQLERELTAVTAERDKYRGLDAAHNIAYADLAAERDALRRVVEHLTQCRDRVDVFRADNERLKAERDALRAAEEINRIAYEELRADNERLKAMLREWVIEQKYSPAKLKAIRAALGDK